MNRSERRAAGKKAKADSGIRGASTPEALHEAGLRHKQAARYLDAQLCCQQALAADPDHADSLHLMGLLSLETKQYDHALEWLTRAIRQDPKAEYLSSLGKTLQQQGRFDEALKACDKAVQLKPDDPELWYQLGNVLADLKRPEDALLAFKHILTLDAAHWDGAYRCGFVLHEMGRPADALPYFDLGVKLQPNNAAMQEMRAFALHKLNRFEEALAANYTAHALNPRNGSTCNNIGAALQLLGRDEEALTWFDRALKLLPNYPVALLNKASSLQQFHRFDEAVAIYHHVKKIDPAQAEPDWNLSLYDLLTGDFEAGWAGRESRWRRANPGVYPKFSEPRWFGEGNVEGKTILVYADEGMGDTIQFARYVPMVAARGARVILVVEAPTLALLANMSGVSQCITRSAEMPAFDMHCPLSTLPLVFETRLDTIPSDMPYLPPLPKARVHAWRARLEDRVGPHDRLRVGLVWSGNPIHKNDHNRSTSLRMLSRILNVDATFFSLQKDPRPDDQVFLCEHPEIIDLTAELTDFVETAALVSCLDLVITIDSSVAHLAAALGRPTWILLPYAPDYRWLLDREDSPWYPTMRLFRQTATRDYGSVLDRVRNELAILIAAQQREGRTTDQAPATSQVSSGATTPDALCAAGLAHVRTGQYADAQKSGEQALAINPDHAGSLHLMGLLSLQARQFDDALEWITRAIRQKPEPEYLVALGITLLNQGRKEDAFKAYEKAVQLKPDDANLWKNLGDILIELKRLPEALLTFQHILTLDADHWYAACQTGHVLDELGQSEAALIYLDQAYALAPNQWRIPESRGVALRKLKKFEESLAELKRAHVLNPHEANICSNLGLTLQFLGRDTEAMEWFDRSLALRPDFVPALLNKGSSLQQGHRFDEAAAIYNHLKTIDPDNPMPVWNLAILQLLTGNFEAGWVGREKRWELLLSNYPRISQPIWLGKEDLEGKTILIRSDEGLGDTIQFVRYVPMAAERGARVLLVVQDSLHSLLSMMPGVAECFPESTSVLPAFDVHCPILSLPLAFGTRLETIPAPTRYLPDPAPALVQSWRDRLDRLAPPGKLRIGLVWSGDPKHGNDHNRSTSLRALSPLLDVDANFISLQKELRPVDRAFLRERTDIIDLTADLTDFVETAALVSCLDLVITIDSSVAHLAAALGRPTWMLLPYVPDYRWLLDREDSPWYPTMRLFRQTKARDYGEVLDRVRNELVAMISSGPHKGWAANQVPATIQGSSGPATPDALCASGLQDVRTGRYADARVCAEQALAIDPDHAGSLHLMGLLSLQARQLDDAVEWITRAIRQKLEPEYLVALGITLLNQGRKEDAFKAYDKAVQLKPDDPSLWINLGDILVELKRLPEALPTFQHVLKLNPTDWYAACRTGCVLDELGRSEEALAYLDQASTLEPNKSTILEARGVVWRKLKKFEESLAELKRAHALNPQDASVCSNLGYTLHFLCRDTDAMEWFDRALALQPDFVPALINKALSLQQLRRFDEAAAIYKYLGTIDPDNALASLNLSLLNLLTGDFEAGWAGREQRWKLISHYPQISQPMWLGSDSLEGKTILIGPDEGLGDTIQFARYVPMVAERGARVILVVQDPLHPLLSGLPGVAECFPVSETVFPSFDVHCPIMSLPLAFGTRLNTIPAPTRYLPDPAQALVQTWRDRLDRLAPRGKLRVGLVWSGNPNHGNDHNRSTSLRMLSPLFNADACFVSLQKDLKPSDRAFLRERPDIIDLTADLTNFAETAALVSCLDLVITIDSSVAHLAAALGHPTWMLLPYASDYRWLLDREDSPWYPTMRLFRQTKTRDYGEVVDRVRRELAAMIAAR